MNTKGGITIEAEFIVCTLDERPIEDSPCYKTILAELGEAFANRWTKVITIPLGSEDG